MENMGQKLRKESRNREMQRRRERETMGLVQGWKKRRRAMREGRGDKNESLFHPE